MISIGVLALVRLGTYIGVLGLRHSRAYMSSLYMVERS
jgi:hypothetical protein